MANHEDFVVTYEINPATGKKEIHVMAGKLMNPGMLAALKNECDQQCLWMGAGTTSGTWNNTREFFKGLSDFCLPGYCLGFG